MRQGSEKQISHSCPSFFTSVAVRQWDRFEGSPLFIFRIFSCILTWALTLNLTQYWSPIFLCNALSSSAQTGMSSSVANFPFFFSPFVRLKSSLFKEFYVVQKRRSSHFMVRKLVKYSIGCSRCSSTPETKKKERPGWSKAREKVGGKRGEKNLANNNSKKRNSKVRAHTVSRPKVYRPCPIHTYIFQNEFNIYVLYCSKSAVLQNQLCSCTYQVWHLIRLQYMKHVLEEIALLHKLKIEALEAATAFFVCVYGFAFSSECEWTFRHTHTSTDRQTPLHVQTDRQINESSSRFRGITKTTANWRKRKKEKRGNMKRERWSLFFTRFCLVAFEAFPELASSLAARTGWGLRV